MTIRAHWIPPLGRDPNLRSDVPVRRLPNLRLFVLGQEKLCDDEDRKRGKIDEVDVDPASLTHRAGNKQEQRRPASDEGGVQPQHTVTITSFKIFQD